jgi:hypothetical protein
VSTAARAGVTFYKVSIAQVLGDNGTAVDHAKTIRITSILGWSCK